LHDTNLPTTCALYCSTHNNKALYTDLICQLNSKMSEGNQHNVSSLRVSGSTYVTATVSSQDTLTGSSTYLEMREEHH